jgi:hypothetical protein
LSTSTTPSGLSKVAPYGTHLRAREIGAVVAHLGDEEVLRAVAVAVALGEAVVAAVGRIDDREAFRRAVGDIERRDVIALHPRPEVERLAEDVVFRLAGADALSRTRMHFSMSM